MEVGSVRALASRSARPAWYDPDRLKRIDRFAALVERGPLDLDDTLRLCLRWSQLDHLALDVEHIARADWRQPAQLIDSDPQQRIRPERAQIGHQSHGDGRGVPARRGKSPQRRLFGGGFVEMEGLRIELRREAFDVLPRHHPFRALEPHADREIFEPFDHKAPLDSIAASQLVPPAERPKPTARTGAPAMALTTTHRRQRSAPERRQASGKRCEARGRDL